MTDSYDLKLDEKGCAHLTGDLTFETVPGLYVLAQQALTDGVSTVSLSGVTTADSAGLSLLLEWQAERNSEAGRIQFIDSPASLISLASLCEASELLNISGRNPES